MATTFMMFVGNIFFPLTFISNIVLRDGECIYTSFYLDLMHLQTQFIALEHQQLLYCHRYSKGYSLRGPEGCRQNNNLTNTNLPRLGSKTPTLPKYYYLFSFHYEVCSKEVHFNRKEMGCRPTELKRAMRRDAFKVRETSTATRDFFCLSL